MTSIEAGELKASSLWGAAVRECDFRIEKLVQELRVCGEEKLKATQLRLKMWEEFKNLPHSVIEREVG